MWPSPFVCESRRAYLGCCCCLSLSPSQNCCLMCIHDWRCCTLVSGKRYSTFVIFKIVQLNSPLHILDCQSPSHSASDARRENHNHQRHGQPKRWPSHATNGLFRSHGAHLRITLVRLRGWRSLRRDIWFIRFLIRLVRNLEPRLRVLCRHVD